MRQDRVGAIVQTLLRMWETGEMPAAVAAVTLRRRFGRPCDRWSLGNRLILWAHRTEDARGYRQWQEVGRHVKRGAKAIWIVAPITRTVKKIIEEIDPATGEIIQREQEKTVLVGFRPVPVFRIEDTEGRPLPEEDYRPAQLPPLFDVARAWGIDVRWAPAPDPNVYGCYVPGANRIELYTHDPGTFWHELAHAAHSRFRTLQGGQVPEQEIVAETVAAALAIMYGHPGRIARAREYVAAYANLPPQQAARAVMKVVQEIEQVLSLILDTADRLAAQPAA